jgi:flagellin-like hook-associated protein FlgL
LQQIDRLAADASYGGINLMAGDTLTAQFNETGGSALTVTGVSFDATGLGLTALNADEFQANPSVDNVITLLDGALTTLRTQAATFGSSLTMLAARQDFTKRLIDTLQRGADDLVLADTDEEGANQLALQTRLGLSLTALSVSAQSEQAVLTLFR